MKGTKAHVSGRNETIDRLVEEHAQKMKKEIAEKRN